MNILETNRLVLRELTENDFAELCEILQDEEVMYAYEHAFSNEEVEDWLNRNLKRYSDAGFGLWAVIKKDTNKFIGQCGLTVQEIDNGKYLEIGYLLKKKYWHNGFAIEAATACKTYAFDILKQGKVYSIIRTNNIASQKVAERVGMKVVKEITKHYYEMDMPHYVYCIEARTNEQPLSERQD
ncbi:MAG: GNAT family N-acetyltransferase [Prevotella sp.]|jgi:RimJ/RimL family protein N-acetyltransferase|nr:GNAT family N-acetyltransferase [Prevotella sp.]